MLLVSLSFSLPQYKVMLLLTGLRSRKTYSELLGFVIYRRNACLLYCTRVVFCRLAPTSRLRDTRSPHLGTPTPPTHKYLLSFTAAAKRTASSFFATHPVRSQERRPMVRSTVRTHSGTNRSPLYKLQIANEGHWTVPEFCPELRLPLSWK